MTKRYGQKTHVRVVEKQSRVIREYRTDNITQFKREHSDFRKERRPEKSTLLDSIGLRSVDRTKLGPETPERRRLTTAL